MCDYQRSRGAKMNPDAISRIRVMGRKATNAEVSKYIMHELSDPNMNISRLSQALKISRNSLHKYVELGKSLKQEIQKKKIRKVTAMEQSQKEFCEDPDIKIWIEAMNQKARGGKPFAPSAKSAYLFKFYGICKTLDCAPSLFVYGATAKDVLEQGRKLMAEYVKHYQEGTAKTRHTKSIEDTDIATVKYGASKVIRDFMKAHGYYYPAGEGGNMSQSIAQFHGKYADVRISEEIHNAIKHELELRYGSESQEWLFYTFGVEAFPRQQAIISTTSSYELDSEGDNEIMVMKVYEAKTSNYKNGIWTKYIFDEELQNAIKKRAKKSDMLFEDRSTKWLNHMNDVLKEQFENHGCFLKGQKKQGVQKSSYFNRKPTHTLRHLGAQRLLLATDWNIAFVASCGWKTAQELIDSYGEMPIAQKRKTLGRVAFG